MWMERTYFKWLDATSQSLQRWKGRLTKLWLIGTLFKCEKYFLGALYEFLHGVLFATMPFWLGGIIITATAQVTQPPPTDVGFWAHAWWSNTVTTFSRGELLVFAISLLSPTLWLTTYEPQGADKLPHRRPISTLAVVVIVVGAVLFALLRAGSSSLNLGFVFWISAILTMAAFFLRYLVFVYHAYRLPAVRERDLSVPTEEWMASVDLHRKAST